MIAPPYIEALHLLYCELTSQRGMPCRFDRVSQWGHWQACGWGEIELRLVIRYLRARIGENKRNEGALKFSNLIGQVDKFEEDLFEARRVLRVRPAPVPVTQTTALPDGGQINRRTTRDAAAENAPVPVGTLSRAEMDRMKREAGL